MGKLNVEGHIHFHYSDIFIEIWAQQPQQLKDYCATLGEPYGYSGQNVFYLWLILDCVKHYSGEEFEPWYRSQ